MNHQLFICEDPTIYAHLRPASPKEVIDTARHYVLESVARQPFTATFPHDVCDYLVLHFAKEEREVFICLFLDNKHRLIAIESLFWGTVNGCAVSPREVVKRALHHNSAAVIAAHNHPSGDSTPSTADVALTRRLRDALQLVDVHLLDHIVVGGETACSVEEYDITQTKPLTRPDQCGTCGKKLVQPRRGRRLFCSVECRKGNGQNK